jgi:hypothetical protein
VEHSCDQIVTALKAGTAPSEFLIFILFSWHQSAEIIADVGYIIDKLVDFASLGMSRASIAGSVWLASWAITKAISLWRPGAFEAKRN